MKNIHTREFGCSPEQIRPWLDRVWTGTPDDVFPRDVLRCWRRNPEGADELAFLPGETVVGHGPFRFRALGWDGERWRVRIDGRGIEGWHGFDLAPVSGGGARLTHTIEADLRGSMRLSWPLVIEPMHDWVVEAMFDRLATAVATGAVPETTTRPMPRVTRLLFSAMGRLMRSRVAAGMMARAA